jgi:hypothetical protein
MNNFTYKKKKNRYFNEDLDIKNCKKEQKALSNEKSGFKFFDFSGILNERSLSMNKTFQFKSFQNIRKIQLKTMKHKSRGIPNRSIAKNSKSQEKDKVSTENFKQIVENARAKIKRDTPSLPRIAPSEERPVNILILTPKTEKYVKFKKNKLLHPDSFKKSWRFSQLPRGKDHSSQLETENSLFPSSPLTSPKKLL